MKWNPDQRKSVQVRRSKSESKCVQYRSTGCKYKRLIFTTFSPYFFDTSTGGGGRRSGMDSEEVSMESFSEFSPPVPTSKYGTISINDSKYKDSVGGGRHNEFV